jgi:hypothetical protein
MMRDNRHRLYRYVGAETGWNAVGVRPGGTPVTSQADLAEFLARHEQDAGEPFTFVVDRHGILLLAPRRSEHVACAGGQPVLAAGEIAFVRQAAGWMVGEVSNHSTGYCPDPDCWPAVASALRRAGVPAPDRFTSEVRFRRCPGCGERNVVKDDWLVCAVCGGTLPDRWNFEAAAEDAVLLRPPGLPGAYVRRADPGPDHPVCQT